VKSGSDCLPMPDNLLTLKRETENIYSLTLPNGRRLEIISRPATDSIDIYADMGRFTIVPMAVNAITLKLEK
jgi:hypothetical protein